MISPHSKVLEVIMVIFAVIFLVWFVSCEPVYAQDRTDPVDMAHPVTKEPGAWIPRWLQKDHLELESRLKTCIEVQDDTKKALDKRKEQTRDLQEALDSEKKASGAVVTSLTATEVQLEEAEEKNTVLTHWLYGTSGIALVAIGFIVVLAL